MFLNGMRATKKIILLMLISLLILLLFLLVIIISANCGNKQYRESNDYYERMLLLLETSNELKMNDLFNFEFDKAYIANETYGDEKYFLKELGVDTNIDILTLESGAHNRILFVKNNIIIYDFIYETEKICITETGNWVFPDTTIILSQENLDGTKDSIVQMSFDNVE